MDAELAQLAKNNKQLGYIACVRDLLDAGLIGGQTGTLLLEKAKTRF